MNHNNAKSVTKNRSGCCSIVISHILIIFLPVICSGKLKFIKNSKALQIRYNPLSMIIRISLVICFLLLKIGMASKLKFPPNCKIMAFLKWTSKRNKSSVCWNLGWNNQRISVLRYLFQLTQIFGIFLLTFHSIDMKIIQANETPPMIYHNFELTWSWISLPQS